MKKQRLLPRSRVGETWEANFNGYPIVGLILKSSEIYQQSYYDYTPTPKWVHHVKIIKSAKADDVGKNRKWKEEYWAYESSPWRFKRISCSWSIDWAVPRLSADEKTCEPTQITLLQKLLSKAKAFLTGIQ